MITSNLMTVESFQMQSREREIKISPVVYKPKYGCWEAQMLKFTGKSTAEKKITKGKKVSQICPGFHQSLHLNTDWCMWVKKLTSVGKIPGEKIMWDNPHTGLRIVVFLINRVLINHSPGTKAVWIHLTDV